MRGRTTHRWACLLGAWLICSAVAVAQQQASPATEPGANPYRVAGANAATTPSRSGVTPSASNDAAGATLEPWNQVERLPPLAATAAEMAPKYGQNFPGGLLLPDDEPDPAAAAKKNLPPGLRRAGCFQGVTLGGSWLATGGGHDALGIAESLVEAEFVLPSLIRESFVTVTPGFGVHRFDCPGGYDVPDDVYDASVGFGLRGRYSERLGYRFNVAVGSYSDFDNSSGDQVRVRGFGSALWKWTPTVDLMFGVAYVDLEGWPVLPLGGLVVRPDDTQVYNLTFPRMNYSRRLSVTEAIGRPTEYWGSIGLEMGGGRWLVRTRNDTTDDMTYRDWRLVLGLEQKTLDTYELNFDVGYVFARRIEYDDDHESFAPDDTISLTLTGRF